MPLNGIGRARASGSLAGNGEKGMRRQRGIRGQMGDD